MPRITFNDPDELLQEVADESNKSHPSAKYPVVRRHIVRCDYEVEWEQAERVSCKYNVFITSMVDTTLYEYAGQLESEDEMIKLVKRVRRFCGEHELPCRNGRIEMY